MQVTAAATEIVKVTAAADTSEKAAATAAVDTAEKAAVTATIAADRYEPEFPDVR